MDENTHRLNGGKQRKMGVRTVAWRMEENMNCGLGVRTPVGAFERLETVQTQRKSYRVEGSNGGK